MIIIKIVTELLKVQRYKGTDMEKYNLFTQARFEPKLFYLKKCAICNKIEFATKQSKMFFTKSMSKIRLSLQLMWLN